MLEFLAEHFSDCVFVAVMIMAMIPTIESKVAIPFGMSTQIWGEATLSPVLSAVASCVGSMLPALLVILIARLVKNKTCGFVHDKFVTRVQARFGSKLEKLSRKKSTFKKCLLLTTFVAVPLPLTGVYTGSLIAGFTNLKVWQAFLSILVGEIFSCLAVLLVCLFFENSAFYIFLFSLLFVSVYLIISMCIWFVKKFCFKKRKVQRVEQQE